MKYFAITLETSSEKIKKIAKENDVDAYYGGWDNILYELNRMLYKNMENDIFFFIYSEEKMQRKFWLHFRIIITNSLMMKLIAIY